MSILTNVHTEFVRQTKSKGKEAFHESVRSTLAEINLEHPDSDTLFRLYVLFGLAIDWFDDVQPSIEEILRAILNVEQRPDSLTLVAASFWNICRNKAKFPGVHPLLDYFLVEKSHGDNRSDLALQYQAALILGHQGYQSSALTFASGYYKFGSTKWYQALMSDCVMYVASRRGAIFDEQMAATCLVAHWEYPERTLPPWVIRTVLSSRIIPLPLRIGMLFMLDRPALVDCVRRDQRRDVEVAIRNEFPEEVNCVLDALLN